MITLRNFIRVFLGLFLLTQCNNKKEQNNVAQILSTSTNAQSENPLTGEWKYSHSIWYASELTLQDNGTFIFHDQGCFGQRFSEGQWSSTNGTILLTSFDIFKQKNRNEIKKSTEDSEKNKPKRKLKKGEVEWSFVGFEDLPPPVFPGPNDTVRIYLDKIQLQLKNDTLFCVGTNKLPEDAKFYKMRINR